MIPPAELDALIAAQQRHADRGYRESEWIVDALKELRWWRVTPHVTVDQERAQQIVHELASMLGVTA